MYGARIVTDICTDIEIAAKAGNDMEAQQLVSRLASEIVSVKTAIEIAFEKELASARKSD